jgi:PIN domain nuclease of toxin-antitoxin system
MRYFIDTNVLINIVEDDYIPNDVKAILGDYENQIFVSSESVKEFIQLIQTERVILEKSLRSRDIFDIMENEFGIFVKYVAKEHLQTLSKLETVEGHNDPNDRLIIAQAITEKIPLISSDKKFPKYTKFGLEFVSNY